MTDRKETIEEITRAQIAEFLPTAIAQALDSYHSFMNQGIPSDDVKEFSEGHKAAKVAISHIELLIKLAKWADIPDIVLGQDARLSDLLLQADQDVNAFKDIFSEDAESE